MAEDGAERIHKKSKEDLRHERATRDKEREEGVGKIGGTSSIDAIRGISGVEAAVEFGLMGASVTTPGPAPDCVLTHLLFFESGPGAPVPTGLDDASTFFHSSARCINCVPMFTNSRQGDDWEATVTAVYFDEGGTVLGDARHTLTVQSDWPNFYTSLGYGWPEPGHWEIGLYVVEIYVNGIKTGDRLFLVNEG